MNKRGENFFFKSFIKNKKGFFLVLILGVLVISSLGFVSADFDIDCDKFNQDAEYKEIVLMAAGVNPEQLRILQEKCFKVTHPSTQPTTGSLAIASPGGSIHQLCQAMGFSDLDKCCERYTLPGCPTTTTTPPGTPPSEIQKPTTITEAVCTSFPCTAHYDWVVIFPPKIAKALELSKIPVKNVVTGTKVKCEFKEDASHAQCESYELNLIPFEKPASCSFFTTFKMEIDGSDVKISDCKQKLPYIQELLPFFREDNGKRPHEILEEKKEPLGDIRLFGIQIGEKDIELLKQFDDAFKKRLESLSKLSVDYPIRQNFILENIYYNEIFLNEKIEEGYTKRERISHLLMFLSDGCTDFGVLDACKGIGKMNPKLAGDFFFKGIGKWPIIDRIWGVRGALDLVAGLPGVKRVPFVGKQPLWLEPSHQLPLFAEGTVLFVIYRDNPSKLVFTFADPGTDVFKAVGNVLAKVGRIILKEEKNGLKWAMVYSQKQKSPKKEAPQEPSPPKKEEGIPPLVAKDLGRESVSTDVLKKKEIIVTITNDLKILQRKLSELKEKETLNPEENNYIETVIETLDVFLSVDETLAQNSEDEHPLTEELINKINELKKQYRSLLDLPDEEQPLAVGEREPPSLGRRIAERVRALTEQVPERVRQIIPDRKRLEPIKSLDPGKATTSAKLEVKPPVTQPGADVQPQQPSPQSPQLKTPVLRPVRTQKMVIGEDGSVSTEDGESIDPRLARHVEKAPEFYTDDEGRKLEVTPSTINEKGKPVSQALGIQSGQPTILSTSEGKGESSGASGTATDANTGKSRPDVKVDPTVDDDGNPSPTVTADGSNTDPVIIDTIYTGTDDYGDPFADRITFITDPTDVSAPPRTAGEKASVLILVLLIVVLGVLSWFYFKPQIEEFRRKR